MFISCHASLPLNIVFKNVHRTHRCHHHVNPERAQIQSLPYGVSLRLPIAFSHNPDSNGIRQRGKVAKHIENKIHSTGGNDHDRKYHAERKTGL